VSSGRKEQRHACSVIGTQQYRRMESNSANASLAKGSVGVKAAGKSGERETNASTSFKAPQAAEERETNAPCRKETAEDMGTRETNVSVEETAAARRDGKPPTSAEQQRRQEVTTAAEHSAAGESSNPAQEGAAIMGTPRTTSLDPGDGVKTGKYRPNITDTSRAGTPASQASRGGSTSRSRCSRRQLTQLLKEGSECFNPDEVRRIVQAARAGPEGSLTAICMLDDDIALFMHAFPDADDRELRAHCLSTLLEYEESMRAWEEAKNSGELDSDGIDSGDEDDLTGIELLRDLEEPTPRAPPSTAPAAWPSRIEWPKRVLRQTILVSSIAAEIESNIDQVDWDADCYEGCRRLLQRETKRIETISDDRGPEEIPVLVDFKLQHWIAEALEGATRATELIIGRVASASVCRPSLGKGEGRERAGVLDPATGRAAQAVMEAATADPLSDALLERIVKLALGKRIPIAPAVTGDRDPSRAATPAIGPAGNQPARRRVESEDEGESHALDLTGPEGSPPAMGRIRPASPEPRKVAAHPSPGTSVTQPSGTAPSAKAVAATQGGRKKNRQESRQSGLGGRRRLTNRGWRPSTTGGEVTAVSSVWMHEEARPE
jgi:hypothetical protein